MKSLPSDKSNYDLLGSNVDITIDAGLYKGSYVSRLEDIEGDLWKLAHPFLGRGLLPIYRNLDLVLSIKNNDAVYRVNASVSGSVREGRVPFLLVKVSENAKKIQRRRFLRVPCLLNGVISPLVFEENQGLPEWRKGIVKDISLGGVRFSIKSKLCPFLKVSDKAMLAIEIEELQYFICCNVAMFRQYEDETFVDLGLEFESLPGTVEKTFMHFVRQQELASRSERI